MPTFELASEFPFLDAADLAYLESPPSTKDIAQSVRVMRGLFPELTFEQALLRTHIVFLAAKRNANESS